MSKATIDIIVWQQSTAPIVVTLLAKPVDPASTMVLYGLLEGSIRLL